MRTINLLFKISLSLGILSPVTAFAAIDANAPLVSVKQDCGTENNCFDNMETLSSWINTTRLPNNTSPLTVDIGAGQFAGYNCINSGYTTLRGSGRSSTFLIQGGASQAVKVTSCDTLSFQDLTISGTGNNAVGIDWAGTGSSTYSNINLTADGEFTSFAWWDHGENSSLCTASDEKSEHFFFGSTISSKSTFYNNAYYTFCAVSWFYGSEIIATGKETNYMLTNSPFRVQGEGVEVQLFGSRVTSLSGGAASTSAFINGAGQGLAGALISGGAKFHMHGGIIAVKAQNTTQNTNVAAIAAQGANTVVHVLDTAFNAKASGAGTAHRILNNGAKINSTFMWFSGATPPAGNTVGDSIQSVNGADMYVEVDCDSTGDCNGAGTETHMMIYNDSCSTDGTWFNSTVGRCRGDTGP